MLAVIWSQFASERLNLIHDYISYESGSEIIATRYISRILAKVERIRTTPLSGTKEPFLRKKNGNFRFIIEGNYKIIYEVTPRTIYILNVFHMKRNPSKISQRE